MLSGSIDVLVFGEFTQTGNLVLGKSAARLEGQTSKGVDVVRVQFQHPFQAVFLGLEIPKQAVELCDPGDIRNLVAGCFEGLCQQHLRLRDIAETGKYARGGMLYGARVVLQ